MTYSCVVMKEVKIKALVLFDVFYVSTSRMIVKSLDIMYPLSDTVEKLKVDRGDMKLYGF
jgi:hypothetical protein